MVDWSKWKIAVDCCRSMDIMRVWITDWEQSGNAKAINSMWIFSVRQEAGDTK